MQRQASGDGRLATALNSTLGAVLCWALSELIIATIRGYNASLGRVQTESERNKNECEIDDFI